MSFPCKPHAHTLYTRSPIPCTEQPLSLKLYLPFDLQEASQEGPNCEPGSIYRPGNLRNLPGDPTTARNLALLGTIRRARKNPHQQPTVRKLMRSTSSIAIPNVLNTSCKEPHALIFQDCTGCRLFDAPSPVPSHETVRVFGREFP